MTDNNLQKKVAEMESQIRKLKKNNLGLVFEDKKEDVVEQSNVKVPVLKEIVKKRLVLSDDCQNNLMIEGDNYLALSVLNYTHKKNIDLIYIDPPYNTGAKNWKYNNDYVDKDDGYRHSKWLSFMRHRLNLAKNLLKDDGVLICAIDENEQAHLNVLLEQLFPAHERHLITIVHNPRGIQGTNFSYTNEYAIFVIPKNLKTIGDRVIDGDEISWRGLRDNGGESLRTDARNCFYPIIVKNGKVVGFGNVVPNDIHPNREAEKKDGTYIYPIDNEGIERKWRYARQSVEKIKHLLRLTEGRGGKEIQIGKDFGKYRTVWIDKKYDANEYGAKLLREIVPNSDFDYPKSLYTVYDCLFAVVGSRPHANVLDFFAGSGTTGHAVLEMNKQDGGNRKFILCTNNENKICEEVTYPRIYNVIKGYKFKGKDKTTLFEKKLTFRNLTNFGPIIQEMDEVIENNKTKFDEIEKKFEDNIIKIFGIKIINGFKDGINSNLKYYKTDLIPVESIHKIKDAQRHELSVKAGQMIAIKENTFKDVEVNEWFQLYENESENRQTAIYFREDMSEFENLVKMIGKKKTTLYIFSYSRVDKNIFNYLAKNIIVEDIPEPILEIYKEINSTINSK